MFLARRRTPFFFSLTKPVPAREEHTFWAPRHVFFRPDGRAAALGPSCPRKGCVSVKEKRSSWPRLVPSLPDKGPANCNGDKNEARPGRNLMHVAWKNVEREEHEL